MTLQDVIQFIGRSDLRWMPTIGGRTEFWVRSVGDKAFAFMIKSGGGRNESHDWIEKSLKIFNETGSFKTSDYPHTFNASYVLGLFWQIVTEQKGIQDLPPELPIEDKEILAATKTEQVELRKSRLGQGRFRLQLIKLRKRCYISGLTEQAVLRASHIKSWKESNNLERLDPRNGLLLTPNYDALFDAGFISFSDDGRILVSHQLPAAVAKSFAVDPDFKGADLGNLTKQYLAHHREHRFRGKLDMTEAATVARKL